MCVYIVLVFPTFSNFCSKPNFFQGCIEFTFGRDVAFISHHILSIRDAAFMHIKITLEGEHDPHSNAQKMYKSSYLSIS